jgi:hypothetical protein
MTWVDGILVVLLALAAAARLSSRREAATAREERARARDDLAAERKAHEATRATFAEERFVHLDDHRQLVSRRVLMEGVPPLDEPLRVESEEEPPYNEDSEEGVEQALAALGGGRMRGTGQIARTRDDYDRLLTRQEELRASKRRAGTPRPSSTEPDSPYEEGEQPLTSDDFAAIDDAAAAS